MGGLACPCAAAEIPTTNDRARKSNPCHTKSDECEDFSLPINANENGLGLDVRCPVSSFGFQLYMPRVRFRPSGLFSFDLFEFRIWTTVET